MSLFDLLQALADDDAIRLIAQTRSIPSELSKIALNAGNVMSLKEQEKIAKLWSSSMDLEEIMEL